jgi:hypothetical protein
MGAGTPVLDGQTILREWGCMLLEPTGGAIDQRK